MRFTLLTLFVAPFITAVVGAAISSNNAGFDGLERRGCGAPGLSCTIFESTLVCCPGLTCTAYPPNQDRVGFCEVS
ncbi:hypothetical protein BKA82DRAFT_1004407, partial [Pisolithus tinctorius]